MTKSVSASQETSALATAPDAAADEVDALGGRLSEVKSRIAQVIFGQEQVVDETLITLLAGGHALLIGVPGLAKTRLVETLGTVMTVAAERDMLQATTGSTETTASEVMSATEFEDAQRLVRRIPVGDKVMEAILSLVRNGRPETSEYEQVRKHVAWGPGPRASQSLMLAVRARAVLHGRLSPSADDVLALAAPVLRHRMALNFSARADGVTIETVTDLLCRPRK